MAGRAIPDITVAGKALGPISMLSLDQPWNGHHSFSIVYPLREQIGSFLELSERYVGQEVTIHLKTGITKLEEDLTFVGIITNVKVSQHDSAVPQLMLQGFSPTILLDDGPHNRSYTEQGLEDIAKAVCDGLSISLKAQNVNSAVLPYITQYKETGFQFLRRLYATFGQWFYYDGEKLVLGQASDEAAESLTFGIDATSLDLSAGAVPTNFKLLGYDYVGDKHFESEAGDAKVGQLEDLNKQLLDVSGELYSKNPTFSEPFPVSEQAQLDDMALRRRSGRSARLVNLFGQSTSLNLKLGAAIALHATTGHSADGGMDISNSGEYRIIHLTHHLDGTGHYSNNFQAIPAKLEQPPVTDAMIAPPQAEFQPAEVLDNNDPDGLGRIQVQFAWQKPENENTPWIRVSAAGAGGSHGAYFVPEKGDQVLIGFEFNNPDRPYVAGSLYNGNMKPSGGDPENNSKIIKTRSGNQIILSDESSKETISIINGSNTIVLSLEGDTSIAVSTTGDLTLSGKNITIEASENLTMSSGKKTALTANETSLAAQTGTKIEDGASVEISGLNVKVAASADLTAESAAMATLSSGATTTVKGGAMVNVQGAMVKLN
ncbi:MAG: phage baseplate assembly protein V [Bacteroidota bacterium]